MIAIEEEDRLKTPHIGGGTHQVWSEFLKVPRFCVFKMRTKWMSHFLMIAFNIGCGGLNVFIQEDVDSNQAQFFCWWRLVRLSL